MDNFKEHNINVRAIDKKEFVQWLSDAMYEQIALINNPNPYLKLNGLIGFELLDYLRKKIENCKININPEVYRQIIRMTREKRHYFDVKLDPRADFMVLGKK